MQNIQLGVDVWVMSSALGAFVVAGIVRIELLAYRVRELERANVVIDKKYFAVQTELNTVNSGLVNQLSEIKETLAWIKGRFSLLEETQSAGRS